MNAVAWLWQVTESLLALLAWVDSPQRAAMLTVAVLAVVVLGCLAAQACFTGDVARLPVTRRIATLRDKSWRVAFLRQRDPDARGRIRPRAPTAAPAAA